MARLATAGKTAAGWAIAAVCFCLAIGTVDAGEERRLAPLIGPAVRLELARTASAPAPDATIEGGLPASWEGSRRHSFDRPGGAFVGEHLLPRLSRQFHGVVELDAPPGSELYQHAFFEDWTDDARRRAERGTRKAVKAWLLEATTLDRVDRAVDSMVDRRRAAAGPSDGTTTRFRLRASHGEPMPQWIRSSARATLTVGVRLDGSARLELCGARAARGRFAASWDADDRAGEAWFQYRF